MPQDFSLDPSQVNIQELRPDQVNFTDGPHDGTTGIPAPPTGTPGTGGSFIGPPESFTTRAMSAVRRNAAPIGGLLGGLGMAAFTDGLSIPLQIGLGTVGAAGGAGLGRTLERGANDIQGISNPPNPATDIAQASIMEGALPELTGQGMGRLFSRFGAGARNLLLADQFANPHGYAMDAAGMNIGRETGDAIDAERKAAFAPLKQQGTEILSGPFGQARRIKITDQGIQPYYIELDPYKAGDIAAQGLGGEGRVVDIGEVGPTNAQRHQIRSDALDDAANLRKNPMAPRGTSKDIRQLTRTAKKQMAQMQKAAEDSGVSMDEYNQWREAYRKTSEKFNNNFMQQADKESETDLVGFLTNPNRWQGAKLTNGTGKVRAGKIELFKNLMSNLPDDTARQKLQNAIQRRLVTDSLDEYGKKIIGPTLSSKIKAISDAVGSNNLELMLPNVDQLQKLADVLKRQRDPRLPGYGKTVAAVNETLRALHIDIPDVASRMGLGRAPQEKIGRTVGRAAVIAPESYYLTNQDDIPEPPSK